jgi:c-di-GMP-specific phosphodiesterase
MPARETMQSLKANMEAGLAEGAFVPVYQPIERLRDGALVGFEALARWRRAGDELWAPGAFIEVALAENLLGEISIAIMKQACLAMAPWAQRGDNLFLTVNVAGRQLDGPHFVEDVLAALAVADLPGEALRIEVTETQVLRDPEQAGLRLAQLRAHGIGVYFDDFGAGYSSLSWLMRLPVDGLKFDAVLTQRAATDGPERKILRAMITLAREMGLVTVGEGVETPAQRAALLDMGCDYAQGHLYAKALAPEEAGALALLQRR